MRWIDKLRGRRETPAASAVPPNEEPPCPHVTLVPRWGNAADMGKEDRISEYACDTCGAHLSVDHAQALRASEAERIKRAIQEE